MAQTTTKTKPIFDIEDSHAYRTIQAFNEAYREKQLTPEEEKDLPRDERRQLQKLKQFLQQVDPSKPITKRITGMVRQSVTTVTDVKREIKDSLTYHVFVEGYNFADIPIDATLHIGYWLRPDLRFELKDRKHPFNIETGEKEGKYTNAGNVWEHWIFVPENRRTRVKFFEDLLKDYPDTFIDELNQGGHLCHRESNINNNHYSSRYNSAVSWNTFINLSIQQLKEIQEKGYYKDSDGILKDRDQNRVNYNQATGKVTAIQ